MKYEYALLYLVCVQFLGEINFRKVSYLHNIHIFNLNNCCKSS